MEPVNSPKKDLALIAVIALTVTLATILFILLKKPKPAAKPTVTVPPIRIDITAQGFKPATLLVKKGAKVTWINKDTKPHRVAANPYPSHTDLPSLDSETPVNPEGGYSYTFDKVGTFGYHDEINPTTNGTIVVTGQ